MKVLFLAPQPFFGERGTPIAVDLVLRVLAERGEQVDVVTYHLGKDVAHSGVQLYRIPNLPFIKSVSPGFSLSKVVCDIFMLFTVLKLARTKPYQIVHAVEESVFIAMLLKWLYGIPYIYDMDSSLAQQMVEKYPRLFKPVMFLFHYFEGLAIRKAKVVVPVCEALSQDIEKYCPEKVIVLHDVSLLAPIPDGFQEDLRQQLSLEGPILMYVGNLEKYQGIDLLLKSFAFALQKGQVANLVVIGGNEADICLYQEQAQRLGIDPRTFFLGPRPVEHLTGYLSQADILVSPRIKGRNTPMKVYSYLDSGKPLLATNLPTHTQVLTSKVAYLASPSSETFGHGIQELIADPVLRERLGQAGKRLIAERHSYSVFRDSLNNLYDGLQTGGTRPQTPRPKTTPSAPSTIALRKRS